MPDWFGGAAAASPAAHRLPAHPAVHHTPTHSPAPAAPGPPAGLHLLLRILPGGSGGRGRHAAARHGRRHGPRRADDVHPRVMGRLVPLRLPSPQCISAAGQGCSTHLTSPLVQRLRVLGARWASSARSLPLPHILAEPPADSTNDSTAPPRLLGPPIFFPRPPPAKVSSLFPRYPPILRHPTILCPPQVHLARPPLIKRADGGRAACCSLFDTLVLPRP